MDLVWFNLEIFGLSSGLVGLYALRKRAGLAPLYIAIGLLLAFLTIGSRLKVMAPVLGDTASYSSQLHLVPRNRNTPV